MITSQINYLQTFHMGLRVNQKWPYSKNIVQSKDNDLANMHAWVKTQNSWLAHNNPVAGSRLRDDARFQDEPIRLSHILGLIQVHPRDSRSRGKPLKYSTYAYPIYKGKTPEIRRHMLSIWFQHNNGHHQLEQLAIAIL